MLALNACAPRESDVLAKAHERGALRVATLNAPTTYYSGRNGPAGFEHDLAHAFAKSEGLALEIVVRDTIAGVLDAVDAGEADLAAAGLTATLARRGQRRFSPVYGAVDAVVVCRRGEGVAPDVGLEVLARDGRTVALADGSAYRAMMDRLPADVRPQWSVVQGVSVEGLLSQVSEGERACTIADEHVYFLHRRYLPNLARVATLPEEQPLAWALGGEQSGGGRALAAAVREWFADPDTQQLIDQLDERYYGFDPAAITRSHAAEFRRALANTLPRYEDLFRREAERADVPWTLLAAVAYQESHWDPRARSPTGVRGLLMLTRATASDLGVTNRLDANQSTRGGARYLASLYERVPDDIGEEDRWWFVLAAYNLGLGHVLDARQLARDQGLDPTLWRDVRTVLPLLEDPAFHRDLPRGYARGREAQLYVQRVRDYLDVLEKRYADPIPVTPPASLRADGVEDPTPVAAESEPAAPPPTDGE